MKAFVLLLFVLIEAINGKSIPETKNGEVRNSKGKDFRFYWSIPLHKCKREGANIDLSNYSVIYNNDQKFLGNEVNTWYRPGAWPWTNPAGKVFNGGIPMKGNLTNHLEMFTKLMHKHQKAGFSGVSCLDFEEYLPCYHPNMRREKEHFREWVKQNVKGVDTWKKLLAATERIFNQTSMPYFERILDIHNQEYPNALTGYYRYPFCRNWDPPYTKCKTAVQECSDYMQKSILDKSTALFPSIYIYEKYGDGYYTYITTRLEETKRVNKKNLPVFAYHWYRFKDTSYIPKEKVLKIFAKVRKDFDGIVLWGWAQDLDSADKCNTFQIYMDEILEPAMTCMQKLTDEQIDEITRNDPSHPGDTEMLSKMWDEVCT